MGSIEHCIVGPVVVALTPSRHGYEYSLAMVRIIINVVVPTPAVVLTTAATRTKDEMNSIVTI